MPAAMIEMGRFTTFNAFMNERLILASVAAKRTVRKRPRSVVENDAQVRLHLHKEIEVSVTCHYRSTRARGDDGGVKRYLRTSTASQLSSQVIPPSTE